MAKTKKTQEEIFAEYIDTLPLVDGDIDIEAEKKMFQELSNVDYFMEWIDLIVAQDIKNYFNATNDKVRDTIRGNAMRLTDLKKRCVKSNIKENIKSSSIKY